MYKPLVHYKKYNVSIIALNHTCQKKIKVQILLIFLTCEIFETFYAIKTDNAQQTLKNVTYRLKFVILNKGK